MQWKQSEDEASPQLMASPLILFSDQTSEENDSDFEQM